MNGMVQLVWEFEALSSEKKQRKTAENLLSMMTKPLRSNLTWKKHKVRTRNQKSERMSKMIE